jgi:hypothetical protein
MSEEEIEDPKRRAERLRREIERAQEIPRPHELFLSPSIMALDCRDA